MEIGLERVSRQTVFLTDGRYRWIVVKRFHLNRPSLAKDAILTALLAHPSYKDSFASPEGETDSPIHGRYRLDALSPDAFDEVTPRHASDELEGWLDQFGPLDRTVVRGDLDDVFSLMEQSTVVLALRNLGKDAEHSWGWVVGKAGFHEFVVLDRGQGVAVIVAGDD
jgi:hypothetical protein